MSVITLDFESFFRTRKTADGPRYTLKDMTYEEYLRDEKFHAHGVGIKIDDGKTKYYYEDIQTVLSNLFYVGNQHFMIGHNTMFDAAILEWVYGLRAARYGCTQSMSTALWAQSSHSLENLAKRLFPTDKTKRKGKELHSFDGVERLTHEQQKIMGAYCIQDCDITFAAFAKMYPYFPNKELDLIDMTIKMFVRPRLILHRDTIITYKAAIIKRREELIKASGMKDVEFDPKSGCLHSPTLKSSQKFAAYLLKNHGITVPLVPKPTKKNPENKSLALAKGDVEFIQLQADRPDLKHLWLARLASTSSGELARCDRLLSHAQVSHINPIGWMPVPLKYCGAHTKRFSGFNNVNFQNFKRKSPIRQAMYAPAGYKVLVRDLANIEGRVNAWFAGQDDKLEAFAAGKDIYNMVATDIYKRPIDRKLKLKDAEGNYLDKDGKICDEDDAVEPDELEGRVGKVAELGLGYGMGPDKFRIQLFLAGVDADWSFANLVVQTWRSKNHMIKRSWKRAEQVIFDMARKDLVPYEWGPLIVEEGRLRLPNGLYMTYPQLRKIDGEEGGFEFWEGKFWKRLYGPLLIENIIQALSRIIMTDMMLRIRTRITPYGAEVSLTVHDEIVVVAPDEHEATCMNIMKEEMAKCSDFCNDGRLVLSSSGGSAQNYSK